MIQAAPSRSPEADISPPPPATGTEGMFEYVPVAPRGLGVQWRLFFLQAAVIALLTLVLGVALTVRLRDYTESEYGARALMASRTVAVMPAVPAALARGTLDPRINTLANMIRHKVGADFIVIADRRGIRWSHPRAAMVGKPLTGASNNEPPGEDAAPMHGHEQISVSQGSLGTSIRAKVPIFGADGEVLGLVSTGYLMPTVLTNAWRVTRTLWPWLLLGLVGALGASMWVSRRIKRELLGLEPVQIAGLVQQHRAVLDALHEGVIVVTADGTVIAANPLAARELKVVPTAAPLRVGTLWPALATSGLLDRPRSADLLLPLGHVPVMVSAMPCGDGHVITFRDRAEFTRIAEELTHSRELTDLLRAQSHEYMNRLHTIAGLIHLGRAPAALALISDQAEQVSDVQELLSGVHVPAVAALIIGKFSRAHEKRVQLILEPGSALGAGWDAVAADVLVPVLGNLIENAFEAVSEHHAAGEGQVRVSIGEDPQGLELEVRDNGAGVPAVILEPRQPGRVSTHGPGRGYGLPLVRQTLAAVGGQLTHVRLGDHTVFRVTVPLPGRP